MDIVLSTAEAFSKVTVPLWRGFQQRNIDQNSKQQGIRGIHRSLHGSSSCSIHFSKMLLQAKPECLSPHCMVSNLLVFQKELLQRLWTHFLQQILH